MNSPYILFYYVLPRTSIEMVYFRTAFARDSNVSTNCYGGQDIEVILKDDGPLA